VCSKYWLKRAGVTAASSHPLDVKLKWRANAEAQSLACFADCEERRTHELTQNQPEPCFEGVSHPNDTECLQYACQVYGYREAMLPSPIREGESCVVPATKGPGTCLAGSCVPPQAEVQACSAYAMRAAVVYSWLRTLDGEKLCKQPGSGVSCSERPLGQSPRAYFLGLLPCRTLKGELRPATAPWGHWPVSLTGEAP
jgi:hypothetical protein